MTAHVFLTTFYPLISSVLCMATAQALKTFYFGKRVQLNLTDRMFTSGGMPSSHSALVTGLTMSMGLQEGFSSTQFAIGVIFSLVVLYDAASVRRNVGLQAKALNNLMDSDTAANQSSKPFKELLGHTPLEIAAGVIIGIVVPTVFWSVLA